MKVKIKDRIYDANEEPIMIKLNPKDKENIKNMSPDCTEYYCFPTSSTERDIKKFIND